MRRCRAAALAGLAAVLLAAVGRAQVQQDPWAETTEGTGIKINCSHPNLGRYEFIHWYRQLPGRGPAFLVGVVQGSKVLLDPPGRLSVAADRRSNVLWLSGPRLRDAAVYYCAQEARREEPGVGLHKLVFGSGTTLTVEPNIQKSSVPQVILMKSKKLKDDSTGKAACLARNVYTKNIILDMTSNEVAYEPSAPILTSEGLYDTVKVVSVTKGTEVNCTANFNSSSITASASLAEENAEEPEMGKVCNTTGTSARAGSKVEKANTLSMAVLGIRVLLAKSIAFNTLMSIKLFLF
ncbi:M1-specific T cell receptor alpha chain-like [Pezoporus flaviventris]|uniref:M1-specific T cell receptor alpha chain-like n=1 Tax=Pezoporus flaviventris TaxID=889875 RepID=UPI002AB18EDA|nr:M1-specific T cell receptor alpha chain-like [Pezoporus flaviventris]